MVSRPRVAPDRRAVCSGAPGAARCDRVRNREILDRDIHGRGVVGRREEPGDHETAVLVVARERVPVAVDRHVRRDTRQISGRERDVTSEDDRAARRQRCLELGLGGNERLPRRERGHQEREGQNGDNPPSWSGVRANGFLGHGRLLSKRRCADRSQGDSDFVCAMKEGVPSWNGRNRANSCRTTA